MIITKINDSKYRNIISTIIYKKNILNKLYKNFIVKSNSKNIKPRVIFYTNSISKHDVERLYPIISYIISIKITKSNIIINVLNTKGVVLDNITSGKLGFKGSQKNKKFAMLSLLKNIYYKYDFLKHQPVILKLKGFKYFNKIIIKKFREKFKIKMFIYEHSISHNGCRPKKKERK